MNNKKILIVDDDEVLGRVLGRVLGQQGYAVSLATSVAEALQCADEQRRPWRCSIYRCPTAMGWISGRELRGAFPTSSKS